MVDLIAPLLALLDSDDEGEIAHGLALAHAMSQGLGVAAKVYIDALPLQFPPDGWSGPPKVEAGEIKKQLVDELVREKLFMGAQLRLRAVEVMRALLPNIRCYEIPAGEWVLTRPATTEPVSKRRHPREIVRLKPFTLGDWEGGAVLHRGGLYHHPGLSYEAALIVVGALAPADSTDSDTNPQHGS